MRRTRAPGARSGRRGGGFGLCLLLLAGAACLGRGTGSSASAPAGPAAAADTGSGWATSRRALDAADSVVLERTRCLGWCPAYRVSVTRDGVVRFESRNPQDSGRVEADSVHPGKFDNLMVHALFVAFLDLPDRIEADERMCRASGSDASTAVVTLYLPGGRRKRVENYHGCYWGPWYLHALEDMIDSAAGSARWVRPARWP